MFDCSGKAREGGRSNAIISRGATWLRQGCDFSQVLFSLYINSLVSKLKVADIGVKCRDQLTPALLYAHDMVMFAEDDEKMRRALEKLDDGAQSGQ